MIATTSASIIIDSKSRRIETPLEKTIKQELKSNKKEYLTLHLKRDRKLTDDEKKQAKKEEKKLIMKACLLSSEQMKRDTIVEKNKDGILFIIANGSQTCEEKAIKIITRFMNPGKTIICMSKKTLDKHIQKKINK